MIFTLWSIGTVKFPIQHVLVFWVFVSLLTISRSGSLVGIRWSVLYFKIKEIFLRLILQDGFWFVQAVLSNISFWPSFLWITFPTQSCLVLYSFSTSLLHSLLLISFLYSIQVFIPASTGGFYQESAGFQESSNYPSSSPCLLSMFFGTVPSIQITISITVTFMFHSFLTLSHSLDICLVFCLFRNGTAKPSKWQTFYFLFI